MLRTILRGALLPGILLTAAAPSAAQGGKEFRAPGFAISLPVDFEQPEVREDLGGGARGYVSRGRGGMLAFVELPGGFQAADTTLETRMAMLRDATGGLLEGRGLHVDSILAHFHTPDAVVARMRVRTEPGANGAFAAGIVDFVLTRRGDPRVMMVGFLSTTPGAAETPDMLRVIGSFRPVDLDPGDLFAWIAGVWQWATDADQTRDNPLTVTVAADRRSLRLVYQRAVESSAGGMDSVFVYRVLGTTSNAIRTAMEGETRKNDSGEPVLWEIVRVSRDAFCWRGSDWPAGACTGELRRVR